MESPKFVMADYLDSNEMITEYLNEILEDGDENEIIIAIGNFANAIWITKIAEENSFSRPSLYKGLYDGVKSQFGTIMKILKAIEG